MEETRRFHFTALLSFFVAPEGRQRTPVSSGFRAKLVFPVQNVAVTCIQRFIDVENVYPGDIVTAEITLLEIHSGFEKLYEGLDFDFFDATERVGRGVIKRIA